MSDEQPFILCLTGSLGMGKSRTAQFFAEQGVLVYDADAVVHELYANEAVPVIDRAFPGAVVEGKVDRVKLAALVLGDNAALARLESIVHPLVAARREKFLAEARANKAKAVLLDIPFSSRPAANGFVMRWSWSRRRPPCSASGHSNGRA